MKIPTFTSRARLTGEAAGVTSNIQVDPRQNIASALRPLGKAAENYYVKERAIEDKVNAGELSSKARVDIFNAEQQAELKLTPTAGVEYFNKGGRVGMSIGGIAKDKKFSFAGDKRVSL